MAARRPQDRKGCGDRIAGGGVTKSREGQVTQPMDDIPAEETYRDTIETAADEIAEEFAEGEYLADYVFEETDLIIAHEPVETYLGVLAHSDNQPVDWKHLTDTDDWEDAVEAMAFTVVRMDLYEALEERGVGQ